MTTPHNAPYKKKQRAGRSAVRTRGMVLWVSCQLVNVGGYSRIANKGVLR